MRILYFHQHFTTPKGASGTRSYEFARMLVQRGHTVVMVCGCNQVSKLGLPSAGEGCVVRGMVDGIEVVALPVNYSNHDSVARRLLAFTKFALRSIVIALREPCDLVFATSTPLTAAIPGIFAKIFRGKPFVFEVRDLWPELPKAVGLRNPFLLGAMSFLEWAGYRAADGLVGLSQGIVRGIRRRAPKKTPVAMIPNGCDMELFKPLDSGDAATPAEKRARFFPPEAGILDTDFVAGFTGAHGLANGLESVLETAVVLKKRGVTRIKFLFVGDGNRKEALMEHAKREGLDNCVFLPPVPKTELARITASLDCGLMVLKNVEAFYYGTSPNKFFDYIAAGIPVVNNYPGWLAEMIIEYGCGTVVPPDSPELFADALLALAAAPDGNVAMRRASRKLAAREFPREKLTAEFCSFLELIGYANL